MHELSIVMRIIDIAAEQAQQAGAGTIEEIEIEIGSLSTIEPSAFDFAWQQAVKHTVLENAIKKISHIKATAICQVCDAHFELDHYYDACPLCGQHHFDITEGKELRVKSLIVT